ncbi:MAG: glycosyltransferase [Bifidobacteriaceae bacterium]|jgi:GT2 family glycosyltransferase/glycosyltransferase involved in cell wall biosynthesis|nr:glycosyltransferase [Bifidobacteriaceae bacterium]
MPPSPRPPAGKSDAGAPTRRSPEQRRALIAKLFNPRWYARRRFTPDDAPGTPSTPATDLDSGQLLTDYIECGAALDLPPHPLFDPVWYRAQRPDRAKGELLVEHYLSRGAHLSPHPCFDPASPAAKAAPPGRNPLLYYLRHSETWGLAPNPLFDGARYLRESPDVAQAGAHPLLHYLRAGRREGRGTFPRVDLALFSAVAGGVSRQGALVDFLSAHRPSAAVAKAEIPLAAIEEPARTATALESARWAYTEKAIVRRARLYAAVAPLFDPEWYAAQRFGPDLAGDLGALDIGAGTLLDDYLLVGAAMGLAPHPLFDPRWYAGRVGHIPENMVAVEHYLTHGAAISPHPAFDPTSPAAKAAPDGANPLVHYLTHPQTWRLAPNDLFDGDYYLDTYSDVTLVQMNPLVHYLLYGEAEKRSPSPRFSPEVYRGMVAVPAGENTVVYCLRQRGGDDSPNTEGIAFAVHERPLVSIVIPVYGHWAHTRACLLALAASDPEPSFEVIVVDDAGPDHTADLLAGASGVTVIRHETNTGYVGACNTGIAAARGTYIALLNNDTRVAPDWLAPLVETLTDDGVGLVGAKLIYPDGQLQEAGGIIFSDGSGFNYGHGHPAANSEFNYRRVVDYCSGAAIVVRASILHELGGLDETFAPAYYDDTDLAFAVRAAGYSVVYDPRAVVIHDEGVSHGTDESTGIKAYQVVNQLKFREKWAGVLTWQLPPAPELVERAARAHQGRDLVVVIDHLIPDPNEDSGSVRMTGLIKELIRQGHGVLFIPHLPRVGTREGAALRAMGVEVAYGPHDWPEFLAALDGSVSAVIVSRIPTALAFAPVVRAALPGVPLIFDTVDLHFLRLEREAGIAPTPGALAAASLTRELELAMIRASETTLVVSQVERDLLAPLVPEANIQVLSNVHERLADEAIAGVEGRDGIVFVGSFAHTPNQDAVRWFVAEVLPLVRRTLPDMPVRIVGKNPPDILIDEAPPGVEYLGWVESLAGVYASARMAIAPLRYGAGVKGKIGEAMAFGIPVITTSVGAEGMGLEDGKTAMVADSAEGFAAAIVQMDSDDALWRRVARDAREHVDRTLGTARFAEVLRDVITPPGQLGGR